MLAKDLFVRIGYTDDIIAQYHKYNALIGNRFEALAQKTIAEDLPLAQSLQTAQALVPELHPHTADLMFILACTGYLLDKYHAAGIPEEMFYDAMQDIRCKTEECLVLHKVFGTFVGYWYEGFFNLTRFAFGRLQFDVKRHVGEARCVAGHTVTEGDFKLSCHIPSMGPLLHDACIDAYRKAYHYFSKDLKDKKLVVYCNSWLLMPDYLPVFRENAPNTYRFVQDYTVVTTTEKDSFTDGWRVFGTEVISRDTTGLPNDTRLRRGFIKHIAAGGKFGTAVGYLIFDGNNILT